MVAPDQVVRALSEALGKPQSEIEAAVESQDRYVLVARPVSARCCA
mgnify:CR=1 FL=1